jgi:PEP-CTERM motif-containing protein
MKKRLLTGAVAIASLLTATSSWAGSIFLTGHDPDFHSLPGNNSLGAQHINQAAINFITNPMFNPFVAAGVREFLFVESKISPPGGHVNGVNGIIASGYKSGVDFEIHSASDLNAQLDLLGTKYGGIVVASDFGGVLTQAELDILDSRSNDIISFLNAGGGLYAMAESNNGAGLTPKGGRFGFLPFIVSSTSFDQSESGDTLTPFGTGLGLTTTDINGNFSHNIFTSTGGLNVVDRDRSGDILSLAGRGQVNPGTGLVPEPGSVLLLGSGLAVLIGLRRHRRAGSQAGKR